MSQSLARVGSAADVRVTQREQLIAFLEGVDRSVARLVTTFESDVAQLDPEDGPAARRILARAAVLRANVADELDHLNDSAQNGDAWFAERVENGREIVQRTMELSEDMATFLETGEIPSESRQRRQMFVFGGVAAAIAGVGYYLWWRREKQEEAKLEQMLANGEIEDCGCTAPS